MALPKIYDKPPVVYTAPSYGGEAGTKYYDFPSSPDYSSIDAMKRDADEKATQAWLALIGGGINTVFDTKPAEERLQNETAKLQNEAARQKLDQQKSIISEVQKYLNPDDGSPRATGDEFLMKLEDTYARAGDIGGMLTVSNTRESRQARDEAVALRKQQFDETIRLHDMMNADRDAARDKRGTGGVKPSFSYFTDPTTGKPVMIDKNNPADRAAVTTLGLVPGKAKQMSATEKATADAMAAVGGATGAPEGPGALKQAYDAATDYIFGAKAAPAPAAPPAPQRKLTKEEFLAQKRKQKK